MKSKHFDLAEEEKTSLAAFLFKHKKLKSFCEIPTIKIKQNGQYLQQLNDDTIVTQIVKPVDRVYPPPITIGNWLDKNYQAIDGIKKENALIVKWLTAQSTVISIGALIKSIKPKARVVVPKRQEDLCKYLKGCQIFIDQYNSFDGIIVANKLLNGITFDDPAPFFSLLAGPSEYGWRLEKWNFNAESKISISKHGYYYLTDSANVEAFVVE